MTLGDFAEERRVDATLRDAIILRMEQLEQLRREGVWWHQSEFAALAQLRARCRPAHSPAKPGFDWQRVTWGRPDSVRSALCFYCATAIYEDDCPLIMWKDDGSAAQFCDDCQGKKTQPSRFLLQRMAMIRQGRLMSQLPSVGRRQIAMMLN
jgi:hypothetical protein